MPMLNKKSFLKNFDNPKFVKVFIFMHLENCPKPELIVNPIENFPSKKAYYEKAYDDNLRLIANPKIYIGDYHFNEGEK